MLQIADLAVGYRHRTVLDAVRFSVRPGTLAVILGRNGCGKSTLLSCISGQLPLWHGSILLDGEDLTALRPTALARRLALLPQGMGTPELSVAELTACGRSPWHSWGQRLSAEDHDIIAAAMAQAGIEHLADRPLTQLSGGERQRAWLAMTLAQDTPLLLLDEPMTYLDPAQQFRFMDTLRSLCSAGKTILAVLHDLPLTLRYADQVILLDGGRCVCDGPAEAALPALEQVFGLQMHIADGSLILNP